MIRRRGPSVQGTGLLLSRLAARVPPRAVAVHGSHHVRRGEKLRTAADDYARPAVTLTTSRLRCCLPSRAADDDASNRPDLKGLLLVAA